MLNNFIAKQDINVISRIEIYDNKIMFPTSINPVEFKKRFNAEINSNSFTTEKALFIASKHKLEKFKGVNELLYLKALTGK